MPNRRRPQASAWVFAALAACGAVHCSMEGVPLDGKQCPCAPGYECDVPSNRCVLGDGAGSLDAAPPLASDAGGNADAPARFDASVDGAPPLLDGGPDCSVHADGRLWCTNRPDALHAQPDPASTVVNQLDTTYSWFDCWTTGTLHAGGNTTWYHTFGDKTAASGYLPAVDLNTPNNFDANPSAFGLVKCGQ